MMMKILLTILLVVIASLTISCKKNIEKEEIPIQTIKENPLLSFKKTLYKTQFDSVFSKYHFNGSVGVFEDSIIIYRKNNGFEDFKNKTAISDSTVFAIASITKQFTTLMLLKLSEEGKIKPTDSAFHYLPNFKTGNFKNITIEQLMNHTSGIVDHGDGVATQPGKQFSYSNKGFYYLT